MRNKFVHFQGYFVGFINQKSILSTQGSTVNCCKFALNLVTFIMRKCKPYNTAHQVGLGRQKVSLFFMFVGKPRNRWAPGRFFSSSRNSNA